MSLLLLFQPGAASTTFALDSGAYQTVFSPVTITSSGPMSTVLAIDAGSYATSFSQVTLATNRLLSLDPTSYTTSFQAVSMVTARVLSFSGQYLTAMSDISLIRGGASFPQPGQVLTGVIYGPNGTEYTGTLSAAGGGAYIRRR